MSGKSFFFFRGIVFSGNGEDKYITVGENFRVDGGTKEHHKHTVEVTQEFSEQMHKHKPENRTEAAEILKDVIKKVGKPPNMR